MLYGIINKTTVFFGFHPFVHPGLDLFQDPNQDPTCHCTVMSLWSLICKSFSVSSLMFHDLDSLHRSPSYSVAWPSIVRCFLVVRMRECILCRNSTDGMSFSICLLSGSGKSICLVVDINFDPVAKMVPAECSHRMVTIFPLVINKCLREKHLETLGMSCFSSNSCLLVFHPLVTINSNILPATVVTVVF